jgi:O-antigen biosynthesis protein
LVRSLLANQSRYPAGTEFVYVSDDPRLHGFVLNHLTGRASLVAHPTRLVLNRSNLGYSAANNVGVAHARGPVLLFQNSDIWVADATGIALALAALEADRFKLLGFRLLYEDGTLQHDGMTFEPGAAVHGLFLAEHPGKGLPPLPVAEPIAAAMAVTGAMLMVSRSWFDQLGGFDPGYVRGDFEDAALCLGSLEQGGRVGVVRAGTIHHLERQSIALSGGDATGMMVTYLNCLRFNRRWGRALAGGGLAAAA